MLPLFVAFRKALWTSDGDLLNINSDDFAASEYLSKIIAGLNGTFAVVGITLLLLLLLIIWMLTTCCMKTCKVQKPVRSPKRLYWTLGVFGVLWFLMLYASCHQLASIVQLRNGVNGQAESFASLPDELKLAKKEMRENSKLANDHLTPFYVAPLALEMTENKTAFDTTLSKVEKALAENKITSPSLKKNASKFVKLAKASLIVKEILMNTKRVVTAEEWVVINEAFNDKKQIEKVFFKISEDDEDKDKDEGDLNKGIDGLQMFLDNIANPFLGYSVVEFLLMLGLIGAFAFFMWKKTYLRSRLIWWLLACACIVFSSIHITTTLFSVVGGKLFDELKGETKSESSSLKMEGLQLSLGKLYGLLKKCDAGSTWPEVFYDATAEDSAKFSDLRFDVMRKTNSIRITKVKEDNSALNPLLANTSKDMVFTILMSGDNKYGPSASSIISSASGNPFQYCEKILGLSLLRVIRNKSDINLFQEMHAICNPHANWHQKTYSEFSKPIEQVRETGAAEFAGPSLEKMFSCKRVGSAAFAVINPLVNDISEGLDGFSGSHHMLAWIGFVLLVFLFLMSIQVSFLFVSEYEKNEYDPKFAADSGVYAQPENTATFEKQ